MFTNLASDDIWKLYCVLSARESGGGGGGGGGGGPRILQKLRVVVVQILELPLYILSSLAREWECVDLIIARENMDYRPEGILG